MNINYKRVLVNKLKCLTILFLALVFYNCDAQVTILVNKGKFRSVLEAGAGENSTNFFDDDFSDDRACTESYAALELANFLPYGTKVKSAGIKFADPGSIPPVGDIFILGSRMSNKAIAKYPLPSDVKLDTEQSFNIRSFKDKDRIITVIEGEDRVGVLYGVYRYLEQLGIQFPGLGEKGTIYPSAPSAIVADLNITEKPSYVTRGFYVWGDRNEENEFFFWMARNKLNFWTAENQPIRLLKKLGMKLNDGGHIVQTAVFASDDEYPYNHSKFDGDENKPADPYTLSPAFAGDTSRDGKLSNIEAHPEWYGMKEGKRMKIVSVKTEIRNGKKRSVNAGALWGTNFCTSNEDARKEFAKRVGQEFIDGQWEHADNFDFWTFDGGKEQWCECGSCKEQGSYTDRMFAVSHDMLKEVQKLRREGKLKRRVEIICIGYSTTTDPPTKPLPAGYDYANSSLTFFPYERCYVHGFGDPSCTEVNQRLLNAYQGWTATGEGGHYKGSIFLGEYYNVSSFKCLPVNFSKIMAIDIPWYHRNGARRFHYMNTTTKNWGNLTLNQFLMSKLLWNIDAPADTIVSAYFRNYYPTTSATSRKFYEQLEVASANIKALKHGVVTPSGLYILSSRLLEGDLFELEHMHHEEYHPLLNDGPDIVEMVSAMSEANKYVNRSLLECTDSVEMKRLLEDYKRIEYGNAMYQYIYHMINTSVFHKRGDTDNAVREFAQVKKYAAQLEQMVEIQLYAAHASSKNGFEATQSVAQFNEFKKLYDKSSD